MPLHALLYRRTSEPRTIDVAVDEVIHAVLLRRHRQARRYTLRIQASTREVVLTLPLRGSLKEAQAFAQKHSAWIAVRLGRLPAAAPFAPGVVMPLRGEPHRIIHRHSTRGTVWIEVAANGERLLCVAGQRPAYRPPHRRFSTPRGQARSRSGEPALRAPTGLAVRRVTVRDQSSRWGSCSTTGMLSYSWRLILAPSYVLDYLAAHEVAHLIEMNHSAKFWRVVQRICPGHQRAKTWLDAHGADLHRYGLPDAP